MLRRSLVLAVASVPKSTRMPKIKLRAGKGSSNIRNNKEELGNTYFNKVIVESTDLLADKKRDVNPKFEKRLKDMTFQEKREYLDYLGSRWVIFRCVLFLITADSMLRVFFLVWEHYQGIPMASRTLPVRQDFFEDDEDLDLDG
eukprot:TRINITY_DN2557_c0_g2_i1.p1 TRINITY_DN2557_c0_g2~~TRINITY_DN2557_c0_g2_i1.p1  ORF type:complete len:165 (+),score=23.64 TRINITY_DN2557_c0_g2_i1:66-497(+)